MRLYLSGGMTNYPEHNFPRFNEVTAILEGFGYTVDNPAAKGIQEGWIWEDYLKYDLHQVLDADGIATLENWRKSKGARLEVRTAKAVGVPVFDYKYWLRKASLELFKESEKVSA